MGSEWSTKRLGDVITLKRGYDLPTRLREPGNVPIVSSSGISGTHSQVKVAGPGVLTGRYGTIGKVFYIEESFWPLNTTLYVQDFKGNHRRFIKYLLETIDFEQFSDKAAVPGVNRNHLHEALVSLPAVGIQEQIADSIAVLEDRIQNLRRVNVTLEAIAQALFKSWFVDFDPVRAKAEGREPEDMGAATAALFPDNFEDSEQGPIPEGWRVDSIYAVADVTYGAPFKSALFNADQVGRPLVRIRDLRQEQPGVWTAEEHRKGYLIQPGDIVVGMDGEFRTYLWGGEEAWLNQRVCVFHPRTPHGSVFLRNTISPLLGRVEATVTATTVIHLGKKHIDEFRVLVPPDHVARAFCERVQPLYDRVIAAKQSARTLTNLRDTLLPRLISGKLRLPDAERKIEAATA